MLSFVCGGTVKMVGFIFSIFLVIHFVRAENALLAYPKLQEYIYFNVSGCLVFFAQKADLIINQRKTSLPPIQKFSPESHCANGSFSQLKFGWTNLTGTVGEVSVSLLFQSFADGSWNLTSAKAILDGTLYYLRVRWPYTPQNMGYKCSEMHPMFFYNSTPQTELVFAGLQVQPFNARGGRFGYASDCVGFFTPLLLSNLMVTFLLLGIFSYGLSMVMSIQTNDAFDDPKGKFVQLGGTAAE